MEKLKYKRTVDRVSNCYCMLCGLDHDDFNREEWENRKKDYAKRIKTDWLALKLSQIKYKAMMRRVLGI